MHGPMIVKFKLH